ncbi:hypothetical protein HYX11_03680 [Candidatus Woesearchaeota archaeon]|nr:hypothetical protein [Candidatus Woesearchaeota archaeon]
MDIFLLIVIASGVLILVFLEEILTLVLKAMIWVLLATLVVVFVFNLSLPQMFSIFKQVILYVF